MTDLIKTAKKGGFKLTRRVSQGIRDRLAKQASTATNKIDDHLSGVSICEACDEEIKPFKLSKEDLTLLKLILPYSVTVLNGEEFDAVTDEAPSLEANIEAAANVLNNRTWIKGVVSAHPDKALMCRDMLIEMLPLESNVSPLKKKQT